MMPGDRFESHVEQKVVLDWLPFRLVGDFDLADRFPLAELVCLYVRPCSTPLPKKMMLTNHAILGDVKEQFTSPFTETLLIVMRFVVYVSA